MTPWWLDIFIGIFDDPKSWRFSVCALAGVVAAVILWQSFSADPGRWLAAGVAVASGFLIGYLWQSGSQKGKARRSPKKKRK